MNAIAATTAHRVRTFSLQPLCLTTHRFANALILLLVPVQFYAAGFGIFGAGTMQPHALIGWAMIPLSLVSVISAGVSRGGRHNLVLTLGILGLVILQPILVVAPRASLPELSALHPVSGLAIGVLAFVIHRRLRDRGLKGAF
jgi:Family of unknown function (DUF6220)